MIVALRPLNGMAIGFLCSELGRDAMYDAPRTPDKTNLLSPAPCPSAQFQTYGAAGAKAKWPIGASLEDEGHLGTEFFVIWRVPGRIILRVPCPHHMPIFLTALVWCQHRQQLPQKIRGGLRIELGDPGNFLEAHE